MEMMLKDRKVGKNVGLRKLYEDHCGNICLVKSDRNNHHLWQAIQVNGCSWKFSDYGTIEQVLSTWRAYKQAPEWIDRKCSSHDHLGNVYALTGTEENVDNSRYKCIAEYNEVTGSLSVFPEKMGIEGKKLFC